ncbi:PadR family transcriptional regulator [Inediibacterium massiliense]|uniref:PadR family transcriptional regulator n=1 Tax=Inediibacterium massiliense TaxID=1658111 RepID=UPI0006B541CB|nr:helix-turn-helix transcriptional regulator [Inediibacterium massiliense]
MDREIKKGITDILVLSLIAPKDMYGYEIAKNIKEKSENLYEMGEGTLYPALKRLENKKFLQSYWGESEGGGRRKYYKITDEGQKELNRKMEDWKKVDYFVRKCYEGV